MAGGEDSYKYWAFISYSHQDDAVASWMHRRVERYRVPGRLVGAPCREWTAPKRILPVFRDREELPGSSALGGKLEEALRASRYLLVVCSPNSAVSRWVNEEILYFKRLGREDRILSVIIDGEPFASDNPRGGQLECFPKSLRYELGENGELTDIPADPIAADFRQGKDGRANGLLKIIAGMLDVNFDALKQREKKRRFWLRAQLAALATLVLTTIAGVWWQGHLEALEAERKRHLQLAELLVRKAREAAARDEGAAAAFYGAHALKEGLMADVQPGPRLRDFLSSLTLDAALERGIQTAGPTLAVAVSPDGTRIATGGTGIELWDHATGSKAASWTEDAEVRALAFAGERLVAGTEDGRVLLFDPSLQPVGQMGAKHEGAIAALAVSPDGKTVASAGADGRINLHAGDGGALRTMALGRRINAIAFDPTVRTLASAGDDRAVRFWDVETGGERGRSAAFDEPIRSLAYSPDGRRLAMGSWDKTVKVWDTAKGEVAAILKGHAKSVDAVAFTPDGHLIVSASQDTTARVWDAASLDTLTVLQGHSHNVTSLGISPDGRTLATGGREGAAKVWRLAPRRYTDAIKAHDATVRALAFHPKGTGLASASDDHAVRIWRNGAMALDFRGHEDSVRALAFVDGGRRVLSAGRDRRLMLWDADDGTVVAQAEDAHDHWIFALAARKGLAVTGGYDGAAKAWSLPELKELWRVEGHGGKPVGGVALGPDGTLAATAGDDKAIRLWNARDGAPVHAFPPFDDIARAVAFSPDGGALAGAGADSVVRMWSLADRKPLGAFNGHHALMIWALAFSPDGRTLTTVSHSMDRQTARLWSAETRALLRRLPGHKDFAVSAAFSPDGKTLATGGTDGTIRLWPVGAGGDMAALEKLLAAPPYRLEDAERLARDIGRRAALILVGSDALPAAGMGPAESALMGRFDQ